MRRHSTSPSGVMSLKRMPGLGKSGTSRIARATARSRSTSTSSPLPRGPHVSRPVWASLDDRRNCFIERSQQVPPNETRPRPEGTEPREVLVSERIRTSGLLLPKQARQPATPIHGRAIAPHEKQPQYTRAPRHTQEVRHFDQPSLPRRGTNAHSMSRRDRARPRSFVTTSSCCDSRSPMGITRRPPSAS